MTIEEADMVSQELMKSEEFYSPETIQLGFNLAIQLQEQLEPPAETDEKVTVEQMRERNGTLVPTL